MTNFFFRIGGGTATEMDIKELSNMMRAQILADNGHKPAATIPAGHTQCPICGKVYKFSKPPGVGEAWEREQHLGGYCSDACWNKAFAE